MSRQTRIRLLATAFFALQVGLLVVSYQRVEGMPLMTNQWLTALYVAADGVTIVLITRNLLSTLDRMEEAYATEVEEQLEASLGEYLEAAHAQKADIRELGHEITGELEQARAALAASKADELDEHLRQGLTIASVTPPARCANATVSAILDSKERQCAAAGVALDARAAVPADLPLPDVELASVFFNLIDNALHECVALQAEAPDAHPVIDLMTMAEAGQLMVSVSNPCRPGRARRTAMQRRRDTNRRHGWGTEIVAGLAKRHGGIAEFRREGDSFTAQVMIPLG